MKKFFEILGINGKDAVVTKPECSFAFAKLQVLKLAGMLILITVIGFAISCGGDDDPPPTNDPLVANAGSNQTVTLASNLTVTLNGTASTGEIVSWAWESVSYTADKGAVTTPYSVADVNALLNNANTATATADLRKAGTYVFKLVVTDNDGVASTNVNNTVTVTVNAMSENKNVGVTFPAFNANPTVIDLNPIYTPTDGWGSFSDSNIRFEIKDNRGNDNSKFDSGTIAFSQASVLYGESTWPWPMPTFTQTFYDNADNIIGEYSFRLGDEEEYGHFSDIYNTTGQTISSLPPPSASPLTLQLSKTVTELP